MTHIEWGRTQVPGNGKSKEYENATWKLLSHSQQKHLTYLRSTHDMIVE